MILSYLCFFFLRLSWGFWLGSPLVSGKAGCQARGFCLYMGHGGRVNWRTDMEEKNHKVDCYVWASISVNRQGFNCRNPSWVSNMSTYYSFPTNKKLQSKTKTYHTGNCKTTQDYVHCPPELFNDQTIHESNHLEKTIQMISQKLNR